MDHKNSVKKLNRENHEKHSGHSGHSMCSTHNHDEKYLDSILEYLDNIIGNLGILLIIICHTDCSIMFQNIQAEIIEILNIIISNEHKCFYSLAGDKIIKTYIHELKKIQHVMSCLKWPKPDDRGDLYETLYNIKKGISKIQKKLDIFYKENDSE